MAADPLDEAQEPEEHSGSKAAPDGVSKVVHGAEQESEHDSEPEAELAAEPVPSPDGTAPAQSAADPATAEDGLPSELAACGTAPAAADSPVASGPEGDIPEGVPAGRELWEEDWRELEPAELAGLLAGTDPEALDDWSVLEYLKAVRKHEAWTQSRRTRGLHRMAVLRPATGTDAGAPDGISRHAAQELAPILALPCRQAAADLADAHQIATHLPATLAALDYGAIDLPRAAAIARKGADLPPDSLAEFEHTVLDGAGTITLESVQARARTARDRLHPQPLETRHRAAMERRTVQYLPQDDGMADLYIRTSADKALLAYNLFQAHARKLQTAKENRTLGQLRADVFTDMLLRYPDHAYQPAPTTGNGTTTAAQTTTPEAAATPKPETAATETAARDTATGNGAAGQGHCTCCGANTTASAAVTAPLTTLLRLAEDPGELTGYGLIPPEMTRNLTALAKSWLLVLTDDHGQAIAAAKDLRIPPEWLKRLVRLRDRHCRDFGCTVPADQCEIDHTIAWEDGGKTVAENLGARCKPGHKTKHHGGGTVTQDKDGTLHFTTRSGHTHTTTPDEGWAITYPTTEDQADTPAENEQGEPPCDETQPPF
ncbi:HNH endonuclease [Arthrobacter sp. NPDC089319]|uniref:HNH endonuclease signature motif containing protein n=1 Tax=Arthrobacter sp. NPDC089319 TaxID=3155915 RepID=UPI003446B759